MDIQISAAEIEFVEQLGLLAEGDGHPRILGRIWGLLNIVGEPITAGSITDILQVSRASISTNLRLLEMLGMVSKECRPGVRDVFYSIASDAYEAMYLEMAERHGKVRMFVENFIPKFTRPEAQRNLQDLAQFHATMERQIQTVLNEIETKP